MRLDSIEIMNYRQYRDLSFDFLANRLSDIHLIIATNGTGKTCLLNAINWCLYNDEPHVSGAMTEGERKTDKLPLANIGAIKDSKTNGDTVCPVTVKIKASDGAIKYIITRSAKISTETEMQVGKDSFEIQATGEDGVTSFVSGNSANDIVNEKLPKKIREYFFFDGEQLLNYFGITGTNVSHLRDSIYEIAQVNVIDKSVIANLNQIISRFQKNIKDLSPDTTTISDAVEEIRRNIENKEKEIVTLNEQIVSANESIEKCDQLIRNTDQIVEDNNRYDSNTTEIKEKELEIKTIKRELTLFVRKYLIRTMLLQVNTNTYSYISERERQNELSPVDINVYKTSLENHQCSVCKGHLLPDTERYFRELIQKYDSNVSIQKLVEIKNDVRRNLDVSEYESEKQALFTRLNKAEDRNKKLQEENDVLFQRISTVTGIQEIEDAMNQRRINTELRDTNIEKIGKYKEQLENMKKELTEKEKEYNDAVSKNKACAEIQEKYKFVLRAKDLLVKIKDGIVSEITSQLESKTMELFESLIWKKDTYGRVELDANFRLKLYHKVTQSSCLNSCSAAEKELLALAFTLAVHEVSGYDNLLFIDTPVGRISDTNRENFANVLLEISKSKQIILAFTPSEYSDEVRAVLNESTVSNVLYLETDEISTNLRR